MFKKILIVVSFFISISDVSANIFTEIQIDSHKIQYITYQTNSDIYNIHIGISDDATKLSDIMYDYNGISAINGVFFCPSDYPQCNNKNYTINERFVKGTEISTYETTGERVVFGWDSDEAPFLYQTEKINPEKRTDIFEGFANFPALLYEGKNMLEHYYDIGLIDSKMRSSIDRHFICSNKERNEIMFGKVTRANLDEVVSVLIKIGCYDAINLDAGKSSNFIYNGRNIVGPGRNILDGVIIERVNINTRKIRDSLDEVFQKVETSYKTRKNKQKSIETLQKYRASIAKIRKDIYDKNSIDIIGETGENIGYQIDINATKTLKTIFLLNLLDEKIKILIQEIR